MTVLSIILTGFALLLILSISLKNGALNPLFLFLAFSIIGIWVRATQLISEVGPKLVLAPWALRGELDSSVILSMVELFVALFIVFFACIITLNISPKIGQVKMPSLLKVNLLKRRQSYFLLVIGIGSAAFFLTIMSSLLGGLSELVLIFQARSVAAMAGRGYIGLLADIPVVVTLFLAFSYFRRKALNINQEGKWVFYGMVILTLVMLVVLGGRGALLQFLLMLGVVYYACKQQRVKLNLALISVLVVSLIVIISGLASRHSAQNQKPLIESISEVSENLVANLSSPFALLDHYMLAKKYVDSKGYDYGGQYLSYFVRPIPRSVWPNKPLPLALKMRQEFWGDTAGGIPPTVFGEFFIAFGYFGLFLGSIILGVVLGLLGRLFNASLADPAQSVFYALITITVVFSVVRSGLEISFVKLLIYMFIVIGLSFLLRLRIGGVTKKRDGSVNIL